MADTVDELDPDPDPHQALRRRPMPPDGPDVAPRAEAHKQRIEDNKAKSKVCGEQATHSPRRRENLIQSARVLLQGVRRLGEDQKAEERYSG